MWTVWFPLVDTPLELGPLGIVPGSHKKAWWHVDPLWGIDVPRDVAWATGPVRPGDIVAYGAATVHCAWSNVSEKNVRVALDVRYEPKMTPNSILRIDAGTPNGAQTPMDPNGAAHWGRS
jgi:ectoine hydroxylase-related dioxygenase (phytanoyl-CoA dioxygenase family)